MVAMAGESFQAFDPLKPLNQEQLAAPLLAVGEGARWGSQIEGRESLGY